MKGQRSCWQFVLLLVVLAWLLAACGGSNPPPPSSVSDPTPNPLNLSGQDEGAASGTVTFANTGDAHLSFTVSADRDWLEVNPSAGSVSPGASQALNVSAICDAAGEHSSTITIGFNGGSKSVRVDLDCGDEIIIPETTKVPDAATRALLTSYSPEDGILVFSESNAFLESLEAGDILVSEPADAAPEGFLREVAAVRKEGGRVVVETAEASLIDAVESGFLEEEKPLTPDDLAAAEIHLQGVSLQELSAQSRGFKFNFSEVILDVDGNKATTDDQLLVSGFLDIEPILDFKLDIKKKWKVIPTGVKEFRAAVGISESSELRLVGNYDKFGSVAKEFSLARLNFNSITFWIGPVPVVITPELEISIKLEGRVTATLHLRVSQEFRAQLGAQYTGGNWRSLNALNNSFVWDKPEYSATLSARGYAAARFGLKVYGVAGSYIKASAYGELDVDMRRNPHWIVRGGIVGEVGIYAKILSYRLADHSAKVLDFNKELGRGTGPVITDPTPNPLNLSAEVGQAATGTVTFGNTGGANLSFSVTSSQTWLQLSPASGSVAPNAGQTLNLSATCPSPAGSHSATLTISSNAGAKNASVNLNCAEADVFSWQVEPASLSFAGTVGGNPPDNQSFTLTNGGKRSGSYGISASKDWLSASPSTGTLAAGAKQEVTLSVAACTAGGSDSATVTVGGEGASATVNVTRSCSATPEPVITEPSPRRLELAAQVGQSASGTVSFGNAGTADLTFNVSDDQDWLSVRPASGSVPPNGSQALVITATCPNIAGSYEGVITITSNGGNKEVAVSLTCSEQAVAVITDPEPASLELEAEIGQAATGTVTFGNGGNDALAFSVSGDQDWLEVSPTSGTVAAGASQTLSVTASCPEAAGHHQGVIAISSSGGDKEVAVSLTCNEKPVPIITDPEPESLALEAIAGFSSASAQVSFKNVGTADLEFTVTVDQGGADKPWLDVDPKEGTVSPNDQQTLTVTANCQELNIGNYSGKITISANAGKKEVAVALRCDALIG